MSGDQAPNTLYLLLLLVLVGSSLVGMRQPIGQTFKMALAWVAIFGTAFALFSFRSEFSALGARLKAEAIGTPIEAGGEMRIPIGEDGHFWVEADVNGHNAPFLVDSGASVTTLSVDTAKAAGIEPDGAAAYIDTANGTVKVQLAKANQFQVGPISRNNFSVQINQHDDSNVLGMNFLSSLGGWRVEGNYLVLRP